VNISVLLSYHQIKNNIMGIYFKLSELTKSDTANQRGIDNTPSKEIEDNLSFLINNVLDPIRKY